jgi:hypothetical protein
MPSLICVSFFCEPVMQITFPVLQEAEIGSKASNHWYTLCLNIEAERFEALDSMRGEGSESLVEHANALISKIKDIWRLHYSTSKVQIETWELKIINVPIQDTMYSNFPPLFYICMLASELFLFLVILVF